MTGGLQPNTSLCRETNDDSSWAVHTALFFPAHTHMHTLAISSYLLLSLSCVSPSTTSSSTAHPHTQCHPVCRLADTKAQTLAFTFTPPPHPRSAHTCIQRHAARAQVFSLMHCLSVSQTHVLHTHFSTHTHQRCTTLSVLEFYILMKEEAPRPIGAGEAGRDHFGADSGVVPRQLKRASSSSPLPAPIGGLPSSAAGLWFGPTGWIRTPPLFLPLFCQY